MPKKSREVAALHTLETKLLHARSQGLPDIGHSILMHNLPRYYRVADVVKDLSTVVARADLAFVAVPEDRRRPRNMGLASVTCWTEEAIEQVRTLNGQCWQEERSGGFRAIQIVDSPGKTGLISSIERNHLARAANPAYHDTPLVLVAGDLVSYQKALNLVQKYPYTPPGVWTPPPGAVATYEDKLDGSLTAPTPEVRCAPAGAAPTKMVTPLDRAQMLRSLESVKDRLWQRQLLERLSQFQEEHEQQAAMAAAAGAAGGARGGGVGVGVQGAAAPKRFPGSGVVQSNSTSSLLSDAPQGQTYCGTISPPTPWSTDSGSFSTEKVSVDYWD
mmetsp:Transcript_10800/g.23840  ORF Transcript_10800/g.23840 Transcript_10800/m.23840 type:complete len:331 (-) Transcript_10800:62-1054(-)